MTRAVADWWDAVELWITQLTFPLQVVLAIVVVLPLCWGTAAGVDRLVDLVAARAGRNRTNGPSVRR
jgi:elongation factor P--beta-lysine ligase